MPDLPTQSKTEVRARLLRARANLVADHRSEASRLISTQVLALPELAAARSIAAFVPVRTEVDITPVLQAILGGERELWLPWVEGAELHLAPVEDLDRDLIVGAWGVPEPSPARRGARPAAPVELVIVPGLAFDRRGHRLGYGGGYYDRLLAVLPSSTVVVAVAFAAQMVDDVPHEPHDICVGMVVTEDGVLRCTA